jgi:putative ABC transport system substrate-binding protein
MRDLFRFICRIGLVVVAILFCNLAIASDKRHVKIGVSVWTGYPNNVRGFKDALTAGGYIEHKNVTYIYHKSGPDKEKQRRFAERFKAANVDMVYSLTTPGTVIIKEVLPEEIPIVFSIVTYPADSGLIESFEYSGNNLVGTSNYVPLPNYVSLLKAILPKTKTVAIFHRKGEPNSKIQAANMARLLKRAGINTLDVESETVDQTKTLALEIADEVDVFMTTTDTLMQGGGEQALIEISLAKKIPILSSNKAGILAGSTFGPVADFYTLGKISGKMAVQILNENIHPSRLQSKLQFPPSYLVNRSSMEVIGIRVPDGSLENIQYIE